MSSSMETSFKAAIEAQEIAGAVLTAQDTTGKFHYTKALGSRTTVSGTSLPLSVTDVLALASSTKLLTTIAVLQCIERGLLNLTEPVSPTLMPELASIQVLTGFSSDDGKPILEDKVRPITLEHLLTHSSGFRYDMMDPLLLQWRSHRNESPVHGSTVESRLGFPLSFQPGTAWSYGVSIDWAGKLVERVTGQTLEEYMQKNIWDPLGIEDSTFWPVKKGEGFMKRMVDCNPKDPKGVGLAVTGGYDLQSGATDCFGGQGVYASAASCLKILHSVLVNDGTLLGKETADLMFRPHLSGEAHASLQGIMGKPETNAWFGQGTPVEMERDWGLGGLLVEESTPGWYGKGTLTWGGGLNSVWFIDRENGLCGFGAPQLLQLPGDPIKAGEMKQVYRKGIYEIYNSWKGGQ